MPVFRQNVHGDVMALARLLYGHIEASERKNVGVRRRTPTSKVIHA